jgi:outer membrane protein assembly factor BamB
VKALGALAAAALVASCGQKTVFRLSSDENNPYALAETLARRELPTAPTPVNVARTPRLFAVAAGQGPARTLVAYDLASGNVIWKADADVQSRIAVGGDFIVAYEGKQLVARDQTRGAPRWRSTVPGTFIGAAADRERAYVVYKDGAKWWLAGYSGDRGEELWRADGAGQLGAPAAHGGVVYVPFLMQWLSIVDGKTGEQLTRIRGIDEQISMLRVTSTVAYFGSKLGIFQLDTRSSSGKRLEATYGKVTIPPQLEGTTFGRDAYDPVQLAYTALDRKRVLWTTSSQPITAGPMRLIGDTYAIHYFRFVLGFSTTGELRWAYSHPRVELVASDHTGHVIAGVSSTGDVVAIEPETGAVRARKSLGTTGPVLGATFDADGWSPAGPAEPIETVAALVAIARDPDARFDRVKELAVASLAKLQGPGVTEQLLVVLADARAPQRLKDLVVELLVQRRDPAALPVLTAQLAVKTDYLAQTEPEALGAVAKTIAGLAGVPVDPGAAAPVLVALQGHLDAGTTPTPDLVHVIAAMAAIGGGAERPALSSHLLLYHADDDLGGDAAWAKAIVAALDHRDAPGERELLRQVGADPRTQPVLASAIKDALGAD